MKETEQDIVREFPVGLKPQDRLLLEMLVIDEDTEDALVFLTDHGIGVTEGENPLKVCKGWFSEIKRGERGKLEIRFSDQGPTMGIKP